MVTESMEGNAAPRPCILADAHRSGSDATLCSGSKFVGFCRFWAQNLWNFDRCFHSNSRVHFEASLSFLAMRDRAGLSRSPEERRNPLAILSQSNSSFSRAMLDAAPSSGGFPVGPKEAVEQPSI